MKNRIAFIAFLNTVLITPVFADVDIVVDNFESYADDTAMQAKWVSTIGSTTSTFLFNANTAGQPYPVAPAPGAVDGTAVVFFGEVGNGTDSVNKWASPFSVVPSATQNVVLSVDLGYDDILNGKKLSLGLRYTNGATLENLIELGFWNQFPSPPMLQFAHRAVLMPGGNSWAPYGLDPSIQQVADMPNDGLGFHRFTAAISLTNIAFSLDLFNDGLNNVTGLPGLDAQDDVAATVTTNGFNDIRFGIPSATGSSTNPLLGVDNISLRLVDIPGVGVDGDYNGNGVVDAADYSIWRDTLGSTTNLTANGNGNSVIDPGDYGVWKMHFGEMADGIGSTANAAAVPEPTALVLLILTLACSSLWRSWTAA